MFNVYSFHHYRRCWPTFIQYLPTMYLLQRMYAYLTNSGSMLGQRRIPLLVQCRSLVYDAVPTLFNDWVCCILCANTWQSPNAVSILTHRLRRWPDIETALGDRTTFSDCFFVSHFPSRRQKHQITRCIGQMLM